MQSMIGISDNKIMSHGKLTSQKMWTKLKNKKKLKTFNYEAYRITSL